MPTAEHPDTPLAAFIRSEIAARGPVTFRWFMEQALYHPEWGYYARPGGKIGRDSGDFCTSAAVGPVWGRMMASQFAAAWELMGRPPGFVIAEQGAHDGRFAADALGWLRERRPGFYETLTYLIIEPNPRFEEVQRAALEPLAPGKTRWARRLAGAFPDGLTGVIFCNELLDAFPVHRVIFQDGQWRELYVDTAGPGGAFTLRPGALSAEDLRRHLERIGPGAGNQLAEVNTAALRWVREAAAELRRGLVLIVDYGLPRESLLAPSRRAGTFRCYRRHRLADDPFAEIGHADMTCHVDFTSVAEAAESAGLRVTGFTDQHHFLAGACRSYFHGLFGEPAPLTPETQAELRQAQALMHPATMGMAFHFLALARNAPGLKNLPGLGFGPDPRKALGLAPEPPPGADDEG